MSMDKKHKIRLDRKTLKAYEKKLRARRKQYTKNAEAFTTGGRRNRALAAGECCLQAMEELYKLNAEKKLLPGTLGWLVHEQRVVDPDGRKGYRYDVSWYVNSSEDFYTEEEIRKELRETYGKLRAETEEMFGETTDEEYLEQEEQDRLAGR